MSKRLTPLVLFLTLLAWPRETYAIPPPDVIANAGSLFVQVFSLLAVLLSLGFSFFIQIVRKTHFWMRQRWAMVLVGGLAIVAIALCSAYAFVTLHQVRVLRDYETQVAEELRERTREEEDKKNTPRDDTQVGQANSLFFEENKNLPLTITNEEFLAVDNAFVLDAREDEEYTYGFYPGSTHIRFADILDGQWSTLPTDRVVYVMCWSGIRGEEVARFLREQGIVAQALEDGAYGWVEYGGLWEGEILFTSVYSDSRYTKTFSTAEVLALQAQGVVLIDVRQSAEIATMLPESMYVSAFYTPTAELEALLDAVPVGARVVTVCDDFVSCFDAKIVGVKLEARGHVFLGRYASPWEYPL